MKKLFFTLVVAALFTFGCQDSNSIVQPTFDQGTQTNQEVKMAPQKATGSNWYGAPIPDTTKSGNIYLPNSRWGWVN